MPKAGARLDPVTLAYLPPKTYPSGVITIPANFEKAGKYAILVTVSDGKDMTMSGKLVVNVAQGSHQWIMVFVFAGIVLAGGFGYYLWDFNRRKKLPVKMGLSLVSESGARIPSAAAPRFERRA